ncbi:hypothetical protein [Dysgonomonas sp.]
MEKRYKNVRAWLLSKERYEDLTKFNSSDEAKKEFYQEMTGDNNTGRTSSAGEEVKLKSEKEIKEEVYKKYSDAIELANQHPGKVHHTITHLLNIIAIQRSTINALEHGLWFLRKYGHPGEG